MMVWKRFYGLSGYWDEALTGSEDYNVFQSYEWGEFKKTTGWVPERWIARDESGSIVGMVQILLKSFPLGIKIGWAPGGPVFISKKSSTIDFDNILSGLAETVCENNGAILTRFNSQLCYDQLASYTFNKYFKRPFFRLNSDYSIKFNLRFSMDELRARMTSKHRYNLNKSLKNKIQWEFGNEERFIKDFYILYKEMLEIKELKRRAFSQSELYAVCRVLGEKAGFITGYLDGTAVSSCLFLCFQRKAFHMKAASGRLGRRLKASYSMNYKLMEYLKNNGYETLDFGGIDPVSSESKGVNNFKMGFGGELIEYIGEWEWTNTKWLRWIVNLAIGLRNRNI